MDWEWNIDLENEYGIWESVYTQDVSSEDSFSQRPFSAEPPCRDIDSRSSLGESEGVFYKKSLKTVRANNTAWTFTAKAAPYEIDNMLEKININTAKAYVFYDDANSSLVGYIFLKQMMNVQLLQYIFGDNWIFNQAPGGCHQNKVHLEAQASVRGYKLVYTKGYPKETPCTAF